MSEEWLNNFFHNQASFSFSYHRDYYLRQKCNKTVGPTEFFLYAFILQRPALMGPNQIPKLASISNPSFNIQHQQTLLFTTARLHFNAY